jgi:hypothetical protein
VFKELRPESLLEDDDPDDEYAPSVLGHPMTHPGTPPGDERPGQRRVSSFGQPKAGVRADARPEDSKGSLYERLMRAGALDEVMSMAAETNFDPRVPLTSLPEPYAPSAPMLSAFTTDLAEELEPSRDSAELLRESDLDILDDGAFVSVRPESSPISHHTDPRMAPLPPRLPRTAVGERVPSVMLGPGASTRADPTARLAAIPSTHPLANTLMPVANIMPPIRPPARRSHWWQMVLAAAVLLGLGVAIGRLQQQLSTDDDSRELASRDTSATSGQPSPQRPSREFAAAPVVPARAEPDAARRPAAPSKKSGTAVDTVAAERATASPRNVASLPRALDAASAGSELVNVANERVQHEVSTTLPGAGRAGTIAATDSLATPSEVDSNLPAQPSREAVVAALDAIAPQLASCTGDKHGVANVTLTVRGAGIVSHALVTGVFAGTPEGSCIARAVKLAHFEPFRDPTIRVTYPFQL